MSGTRFPGKLHELDELIMSGALTDKQLRHLALLVSSIESFRRGEVEDAKPKQSAEDRADQRCQQAAYWRVLGDRYEKFLATLLPSPAADETSAATTGDPR